MMTRPLLLDTCAAIWMLDDAYMSDAAVTALDDAYDRGEKLRLCPITAWEIGLLVARGKIPSVINPNVWFRQLAGAASVQVTELTSDILIQSSFLPGEVHKDPADRIIIATARELGLTVVTRDSKILDYAARGHVAAIAC